MGGSPIDPDTAPVGPIVLLPSMIYHQVLFDSTEITPAWLRSRSGPNPEPARPETSAAAERAAKPAASTDKEPASKATRRKKAVVKPAEPKQAATRKARGPTSGRHKSQ